MLTKSFSWRAPAWALLIVVTGCPEVQAQLGDQDHDGVAVSQDCDDFDPDLGPFADEICDGKDNDCDGRIDDADDDVIDDQVRWYRDQDGDGYGDPSSSKYACERPTDGEWVENDDDCDDSNRDVSPFGGEVCNGVDDDCDGEVDDEDGDVVDRQTWFEDGDGDGFGDPASSTERCDPEGGEVSTGTDCDDSDGSTYPEAMELYDGKDNDCQNDIDEDYEVLPFLIELSGSGMNGSHVNGDKDFECSAISVQVDLTVINDGALINHLPARNSGHTHPRRFM